MAHLDNKIEQEKKELEFNQEFKINDADHHLLIDLLKNPHPANDEMKKLMALNVSVRYPPIE